MGWRGSGEHGAALLTAPEQFSGTRRKPWLSTHAWTGDAVSLWVPNQCVASDGGVHRKLRPSFCTVGVHSVGVLLLCSMRTFRLMRFRADESVIEQAKSRPCRSKNAFLAADEESASACRSLVAMGREHCVLALSESAMAGLGPFQDLGTQVCQQIVRG